MSPSSVVFHGLSFRYDTASAPLFENLSAHFTQGWTGVVGANGAGKTTLLRLATGALAPTEGRVDISGHAIYCAQRTDEPQAAFVQFVQARDAETAQWRARLGVAKDWPERWDTLSHGERKRAQIATALWQRPHVLAIDEPTNHVDAEARALIADALQAFDGCGLLVSHDRDLLDALCSQCLFVDPPTATMRPGTYTAGADQAARERQQAVRQRKAVKHRHAGLRREVIRRKEAASHADRMRSKRRIGRKDHDAKEKIDRARITGKDARAGRLLRQLAGRLGQTEAELHETKVKKEHELGIWIPSARSKRDFLFTLDAGEITLGTARRLRFPTLCMPPDGHVAITGPNGSGKSTLVAAIIERLKLPEGRLTYVPQEVDLESSRCIAERVLALGHDDLARVMTIVSRLNSRPERLMETDAPSPGEIRKILLALGIAREPHLIVMDEPTNHMDLPSTECLESALEGCPCGLLLVSHDMRFLKRLTTVRWHIESEEGGSRLTERAWR